MDNKLKIIIVDDHDLFREGVKVLLGKSNKIVFIGEASNGKDFLELLKDQTPDVILMDISMPVMDGIEATKQAMHDNPDLKILALSMFGEEEYYYKMIHAGVRGFVMKSSGINELEFAIEEIARGSCFFSPELLNYVILNVDESKPDETVSPFSENEMSILKHISKNLSDEEIAAELNLDVTEVKKLHAGLLEKTGSNNTAALIMYAIKSKIITV